jgi:SAM-dependent methyltransferase
MGANMTTPDPLSDPTGWYEHRYAAAEQGQATIPWDRGAPRDLLLDWARDFDGSGLRAIVVGCGLGSDAEFLARLGYDTVAFDASVTAIKLARERFPESKALFLTADLMQLPDDWRGAFDLVVEIQTVQSMPLHLRESAIARIADLVAPGGTLFVAAVVRDEHEPFDGPPWPLTRDEVASFGTETLALQGEIEVFVDPDMPGVSRWRAIFRRG